MLRVAADRVKVGLSITAISYILSYYIEAVDLGQHIYFIGHAIGLLVIASGITKGVLKDIIVGFSFGRLYDEFYFFVYDNSETLLSYSLVFIVLVPLLGYCWRKYRKRTSRLIAVSILMKGIYLAIGKLLDWIYF